MRTWMACVVVGAFSLAGVALLTVPGCGSGGGGGGGGSGVAELAGGWLGPTGAASAGSNLSGTGGGGMNVDLSGAFAGTGAFSGKAGQIQKVAPRTYSFSRMDTVTGYLLLNAAGTHLAYIDSDGMFGLWRRASANPGSHTFTTGDAFMSGWAGELGSLDANHELTGVEAMVLGIDGTGMITATSNTTNAVTNAQPLALVDAANGEFTGDWVDNPDIGTYTLLMSEDLSACAMFVCGMGGTFPQDCSIGIFGRQP